MLPQGLLFLFPFREVSRHGSEVLVSCSDHDGENSLASVTMNDTTTMGRAGTQVTLWQGNSLAKPVHNNSLKLSDGWTADPVEVSTVESIGVDLSEGSRVGTCAGEECHEARR